LFFWWEVEVDEKEWPNIKLADFKKLNAIGTEYKSNIPRILKIPFSVQLFVRTTIPEVPNSIFTRLGLENFAISPHQTRPIIVCILEPKAMDNRNVVKCLARVFSVIESSLLTEKALCEVFVLGGVRNTLVDTT
jgi:hypothetical protein